MLEGTTWHRSARLEMKVAQILQEQAEYGWTLDQTAAKACLKELQAGMAEIERVVVPNIPGHAKKFGVEVRKPFKADGSYSKMTTDWYSDQEEVTQNWVIGQFSRIEWLPIKLTLFSPATSRTFHADHAALLQRVLL